MVGWLSPTHIMHWQASWLPSSFANIMDKVLLSQYLTHRSHFSMLDTQATRASILLVVFVIWSTLNFGRIH